MAKGLLRHTAAGHSLHPVLFRTVLDVDVHMFRERVRRILMIRRATGDCDLLLQTNRCDRM
jgi:hypothetical protein